MLKRIKDAGVAAGLGVINAVQGAVLVGRMTWGTIKHEFKQHAAKKDDGIDPPTSSKNFPQP